MGHETTQSFAQQVGRFQADYAEILQQVGRVIVGHDRVVHQVLACLLGGGHALLEGVPGLGKTLLVRTLGQALRLSFSRLQFTPDLMPADIIGTSLLVADEHGGKTFRFQNGPIFANLVLADEINRATPKTQSAVLEAMAEQTVSVAGATRHLPAPFFVLATQNPLEMEGTYPLPEAQLDRFMMKILLTPPSLEEMVDILDRTTGGQAGQVQAVASAERVEQMRRLVRQVPASQPVKRHAAELVLATHPQTTPLATVRQFVRYGASPRAAQAMLLAGKVSALRDGRGAVSFQDIRQAALPCLRHRLILSFEGQAEGIEGDGVVEQVLAAVAPPPAE